MVRRLVVTHQSKGGPAEPIMGKHKQITSARCQNSSRRTERQQEEKLQEKGCPGAEKLKHSDEGKRLCGAVLSLNSQITGHTRVVTEGKKDFSNIENHLKCTK